MTAEAGAARRHEAGAMTAIDRLCPVTVDHALARAAALAPDVEAIVAPDGRMPFAALTDEVARLRAALAAAGVGRGDHVGLCLGNSTRWVALFLALGSLGAVTVPLNTRFKAGEMAYALRQARVTTLVTADRLLNADLLGALREACPGVDTGLPCAELPDLAQLVVVGDDVPAAAQGWEAFLAAGEADPGPAAAPDDTLLIQFTSGTTSRPKGVPLTQRQMLGNGFVSGARLGLRVADRLHAARPFFHVAGTTLSILSCLQHAATLVTMTRFEPAEALRLMEQERCTHFAGNDTMALMLLDAPERASRRLALRGAWLAASPAIVARVIDELGAGEAVVGYGLSEASPNVAQSCHWEPREVRVEGWMRPQPGLEVRLVADGRAVAAGETGEIQVRGWSVMGGYFDKPEESAAVLSSDGWLSTGDLGRRDADGRLQFAGRLKELIRVGGENVSPAEVEDMLHRHPDVRQAQVVGVPDARLVEVPVAFVVPVEGAAPDPDEIGAWARARLAGFKAPRKVWIVADFESIGMTASAKVQKSKLAAHAATLLAEDPAG